ncbi:DUF6266 family protein [Pedobacter frigoris]|uniref:Uncharacterized protein n=1 Tax=Pedobacter frigoris TaxID=2571272 RepID=A0A4U1CAR4_9SPHI|nr:DUF6266 family protein [Pedobacter frigoris]TKC02935.1 hypothetical protein FA047_19925 [Pedobacter frigoris]
MGTLDNGAFGHLRGKVGNLVSYTLNGKNVVRELGETTKPPTKPKLANYQKMAVVNAFLKPILPFIKLGFAFAIQGTDHNQHNEAVSYNKRFALQGEYPNIEMDYSKALLSKGNLPPALLPATNKLPNGVEFTWQVPADMTYAELCNRAMLLLYFPESKTALFDLSGARRSERRDFFPLEPEHLAQIIHAYIAFVGDDRLSVSDSTWIKKLN